MTLEILELEPLAGYEPEIGQALWRLQDARARLLRHLTDLPPEALDWLPEDLSDKPLAASGLNSIGTLLYHIAAIEADWLYCEVLEIDFPPQAVDLFPFEVRDSEGRLTAVRDLSLQAHLHRLEATRQLLLAGFTGMTTADFQRQRVLPQYRVTPAWVLHHLTLHETEHRGEIQTVWHLFRHSR